MRVMTDTRRFPMGAGAGARPRRAALTARYAPHPRNLAEDLTWLVDHGVTAIAVDAPDPAVVAAARGRGLSVLSASGEPVDGVLWELADDVRPEALAAAVRRVHAARPGLRVALALDVRELRSNRRLVERVAAIDGVDEVYCVGRAWSQSGSRSPDPFGTLVPDATDFLATVRAAGAAAGSVGGIMLANHSFPEPADYYYGLQAAHLPLLRLGGTPIGFHYGAPGCPNAHRQLAMLAAALR